MSDERERDELPDGFVRFSVGGAEVVCAPHVADGVRTVLAGGTLYRYAQSHVHARALSGRGVVFAVPLPGDVERIVVRHNWHGGLFAALTRDWFRLPTRAPHELLVSEQLRALHVPTPAMLGYVIYHSVAGLVRVDVFSREVPDSFDLAEVLRAPNPADVVQAWSATRQLVRALAAAGARHHDLNVKNILLQRTNGSGFAAYALDVDRVQFDDDRDAVNEANIARLMRSARKWQQELAAPISDSELRDLEALLRRPQPAPTTAS